MSCQRKEHISYLRNRFVENGLILDKESEALLEDILEQMQKSSAFIGEITLDNLCEDILSYAEQREIRRHMTVEKLKKYMKEPGYLESFMEKETQTQSIGLIPGIRG